MTSTPPPPPKHGGSGPFIIAALIMLLLMGGLIYWKLGSNEPKESSKPPPPPPPTAALLDEPPPPPPPPEEPKEDAGAPKQPKRVASTSGGCAGECKGEAPGNLRAMLTAKGGQARGCYERALRQNNMLQGKMTLALRIGPNGSVCSANVAANELGDPGVASCVVSMFRGTTYPNPQGGCVDVNVPLRFEPRK